MVSGMQLQTREEREAEINEKIAKLAKRIEALETEVAELKAKKPPGKG